MTYKVRASSFSDLLSGLKVRDKYEWKDLEKMNETHIALAISIFNKSNEYESPKITTLDLNAGIEREEEAVKIYDEFFKTNFFPSYKLSREKKLPFEKSNDYLTGSRDFGNERKTIDLKASTDKNVFDNKKFSKIELNYIIQINCYGLLYDTDELEICNILMNKTQAQIAKMIFSESYIENISDEEKYAREVKYENMYCYDLMPLSQRIDSRKVDVIDDFEKIVKKRVEVMNYWIEKNKHKLN